MLGMWHSLLLIYHHRHLMLVVKFHLMNGLLLLWSSSLWMGLLAPSKISWQHQPPAQWAKNWIKNADFFPACTNQMPKKPIGYNSVHLEWTDFWKRMTTCNTCKSNDKCRKKIHALIIAFPLFSLITQMIEHSLWNFFIIGGYNYLPNL